MPITGLTTGQRQFLKLGQIRKGDKQIITRKRSDGTTYLVEKPIDLDHFRVTFHGQAEDARLAFVDAYGEAPTEIRVRFAFPDIEQVWDANYECYSKGGLICKAASTPERGLYWIFYRSHENGEVLIRNGEPVNSLGRELASKPIELDQPIYMYKNMKGDDVPCFLEPVGRLQVVVPEVAAVAVGYLEFRPGSSIDIRNISAELAAYDLMARSAGKTICGIPFKLIRRAEEVTVNIDGKLSKKESWVVHLNIDSGEWASRALAYLERKALPDVVEGEVMALPSGLDEDEWMKEPAVVEVEDEPPPWEDKEVKRPRPAPSLPVPEAENGGDEKINPLDAKWVKWAADQWGITASEAAKRITSLGLGHGTASLSGFKAKVMGGEVVEEDNSMSPVDLKTKIAGLTNKHLAANATDVDRNVLAKTLTGIFPDQTDRYEFTRWATDSENGSTKDLLACKVKALLDWLGVATFSDVPSEKVTVEARKALFEAMQANGQAKLL